MAQRPQGRRRAGGGAADVPGAGRRPRVEHRPAGSAGIDARARAHSPQRDLTGSPPRKEAGPGGGSGLGGAQRPEWQWHHGADTWVAYEPEHSVSIEDCFQAGSEACQLGEWRIAFATMRQYVAADPSRSRAVRRNEIDSRGHAPAQQPQMAPGRGVGGGGGGSGGGGAGPGAGAGGAADRAVQIWNHSSLEVGVQATQCNSWSATLSPVGAPSGAWHGCGFTENEILHFRDRNSGTIFGEWTVTAHKVQQLFCEVDPHTALPTVRAMACHDDDAEFDRYTFHPMRAAVKVIRAAGRPVTIHEVAAQTGLREYPVPKRQQALDQQLQSRRGSPKRERRSGTPQKQQRTSQQHEGGRGGGGGGAGAGAGGSVVHEVQPPVNTIAIAILAHLEVADPKDSSTNWKAISRIYTRGGCTALRGACMR
eukprot:COSAG02_NODE_2873_length_7852_cov_41.208177_2_plen_423_part_00